ncbi:hypothetical protein [Tabrizicola oligotrophica]|uniref:Tetratricopeptide repeat protein n=1 Tax=Tabrizicola oligotrophica TaxID=2710650 RepID=A0A6M0QUK2_9RHOB|nr:hypothetical protein [Tabrizicola oligotrophica]NEY91150.1 hypothetical protein [Tabrizicola oligotrophica]
MTRLLAVLLFVLASPALAQPVRVSSGEHDGFTRLVFDFGHPVDWQVGRSADGYLMHLSGPKPAYDLTEAFDLIGTSRLAAIWASEATGDLQVGLACACHAIPFEFRPGIVVIDLKDGAPPKGSAFEMRVETPLATSGDVIAHPAPAGAGANRDPGFDWKDALYGSLARREAVQAVRPRQPGPDRALPLPDPTLQPLRDSILYQFSRGAAQGVVDMVEMPKAGPLIGPDIPSVQMRIGEAPTRVGQADTSVRADLGAEGARCVDDAVLEIASWGQEAIPFAGQIADTRRNLSVELDKADPEAVARAIRLQLYLGFGAEARQMLKAFGLESHDANILKSLSFIIDGDPDPGQVFVGLAACKGPAALWALLDSPLLARGDPLDEGAIRLAFSGLPLHLRRYLAPRLAERFLALGKQDAARAVRDAITRAPGDPGHGARLLEAELDLRRGDAAKAETAARSVLSDPGQSQPEALIALTEARITQRLPIAQDVLLALQAHLEDQRGTPLETRLQEAVLLAQAASGNFAAAFEALPAHPNRTREVWDLAASLASDDAFLAVAVLAVDATPPHLPDATISAVARRLTDLGLTAAAQPWLEATNRPDPLLAAEIALGQRDAHAALAQLKGIETEVAQGLRLQALNLLDAHLLRAELLAKTGDQTAATVALARAGAWERLKTAGEGPWQSVSQRLRPPADATTTPDAPSRTGTLAKGHALVDSARETRAAIDTLLATVSLPESVSQ